MQDENGCSCQIARNIYDAARCASCWSRDRSDFAESFGSSVATVTAGSDRASRLPWLVWRITLDSRRAMRVRRLQVGFGKDHDNRAVFLGGAEIHLPHQAADDPRTVELRAGMFGIERKARDRQSAAALLRLVDGAGKVALEGFPGEQAGPRVDQAIGVDGLQRAAQMRFEGMLADQRQRRRDYLGGVAGNDLEVRQIVGRRQIDCRHDDGKVAEPGVLRQHGEEGVDHARAETFAEHDAVDVSDIEMLRSRLDRERADHAGALAKRDRQAWDRRRRGRSAAR